MLRLQRGLLAATACCRSCPTAQRWLCVVWGSVGWYGVVWGPPSLLQAPGSCILEWDDRDFARKSSEGCFEENKPETSVVSPRRPGWGEQGDSSTHPFDASWSRARSHTTGLAPACKRVNKNVRRESNPECIWGKLGHGWG